MRITILTAGSQGDIQPYLALAVGMKNAGYRVRFAANSNFAGFAARYGLEFFPIRVDSMQFVQTPQAQAWLESDSVARLIISTFRAVRSVAYPILVDVWEGCRESDVILYNSFALPFVYFIGKKLDIPCIPASIDPLPNGSHTALPLNIHWNRSRAFNLLSHRIVDEFVWQVYLPLIRKAWKDKVKISFISPYRRAVRDGGLILSGYSPSFLPRPADLPKQIVITGYWFLEPEPGWRPDPSLVEFIEAGERPMYVGFGSMGNATKNRETADLVLRTLAETNQRAVLGAGWSDMGAGRHLPENVFLLKSVSHRWLFPQMAAVVHHAGPGTTAAALSAGVPNVVVPHFASQFFYAKRVADLGLGPQPIPRSRLTAERLTQAISIVANDRKIHERAIALGKQVNAEDGIQTAIRALRPYIG